MEDAVSAEENAALVREMYAAFNDHELDRTVAVVSDDFTLLDVATGQTYHGPQGFKQWLQPWLTAVPNGRAELTNLLATDDAVATEHVGRGTHSGPLVTRDRTIPASGRPVELSFAEVIEVGGGKLVAMRAYWDAATLLRQVGALD
jgi:steroid delta-isomerase-like uncharacterized protein